MLVDEFPFEAACLWKSVFDVAARSQREIDIYRRYPECFGYGFFIMQRA